VSIDHANGHFYLKTKVKNEIKKNEIKKNEKKSEKNRGQLGRPEMWQVEDIYFCWSFSAQSPFSLGMTFHLCIWSLQVTYLSSSGILWSWTRVSWVRPKFWLRFCGYALVRPFMYLDPPTLLRPKPYFDFFGQTLLRPKLYFDLCFSTNKKPRFDKRSKYRSRSREVEVRRSKYTSRSKADEVQKRPKIWKWSMYRKGRTVRFLWEGKLLTSLKETLRTFLQTGSYWRSGQTTKSKLKKILPKILRIEKYVD